MPEWLYRRFLGHPAVGLAGTGHAKMLRRGRRSIGEGSAERQNNARKFRGHFNPRNRHKQLPLVMNLEDKERKQTAHKDHLAREQRYLRRRLESLGPELLPHFDVEKMGKRRSVSESSSFSSSSASSSSSSSSTSESEYSYELSKR
ncbi:putative max-interacting protein 1-like [Homarus americanus]|uniref:Putative max-interacting protein 1-like n=1 Tax=Homarus americanus TaxID=6706 RepID=A0A8J5N9M2_HOMAM|nr:putative max-interacting protein 1-like [Homarus americanus]